MIKIEWKSLSPIGFDAYSVSSDGQVKNNKTGRILKYNLTDRGYYRVKLYNNTCHKDYRVHRLVAMAFIPNPNNFPQVNHKDECHTNNNVDNLEWCDDRYNKEYSKLNKPVDCYDINGNFIKSYWCVVDAARECNANVNSIANCCNGDMSNAGGYKWSWRV